MFYFVKEHDKNGNKIDYSNYTEEQLKQCVEHLKRWNRETIEKPRIIWSNADIISPVLEEDNTWTIYFNYEAYRANNNFECEYDEDEEERGLYYSHEDDISEDEYTLDGWVVINPHNEEIVFSTIDYSKKIPDIDVSGEVDEKGILHFNFWGTYVSNLENYSAQKLREAIINGYKATKFLDECRDAYKKTGGFSDHDLFYSKSKFIFSVSSKETPVDAYKIMRYFDLENNKKNSIDEMTQEINISDLPFSLSDAVVCFTGIRDNNLENAIKQQGGKIVSSITKACNYLIYSSDDSVKYRQAKERNIYTEHYIDAKKRFGM